MFYKPCQEYSDYSELSKHSDYPNLRIIQYCSTNLVENILTIQNIPTLTIQTIRIFWQFLFGIFRLFNRVLHNSCTVIRKFRYLLFRQSEYSDYSWPSCKNISTVRLFKLLQSRHNSDCIYQTILKMVGGELSDYSDNSWSFRLSIFREIFLYSTMFHVKRL